MENLNTYSWKKYCKSPRLTSRSSLSEIDISPTTAPNDIHDSGKEHTTSVAKASEEQWAEEHRREDDRREDDRRESDRREEDRTEEGRTEEGRTEEDRTQQYRAEEDRPERHRLEEDRPEGDNRPGRLRVCS